MSEQNTPTISWQAPEFRHYPKNTGWYVTLISVGILVIAFFAFILNDIFGAVCLAVIGALVIIFSRHTPKEVEIELNSRGIRFGQLTYPYKQIKYFWLVTNEKHNTLNFHTSALLNNIVVLELEGQDPEEIRQFLGIHIVEHPQTDETFAQRMMHLFKF